MNHFASVAPAAWVQTLLDLAEATRQGIVIKAPGGSFLAFNDLMKRLWKGVEFSHEGLDLHPAVVDMFRVTDTMVLGGRTLELQVPYPHGWVAGRKALFRGHVVVLVRSQSLDVTIGTFQDAFPSLSGTQAEFLASLLPRVVASPEGTIRIGDLPCAHSSARRYLRQLEEGSILRRERTGRGLRIYPSLEVFCVREAQ